MTNGTNAPSPSQPTSEFLDIAGYQATGDYCCFPGRTLSKTGEELDRVSLEKLWHTGFDVASLDEAHEKWKISPLRSVVDIWTILGHEKAPVNAKGGVRFTENALTSLAIQYPSLLDRGEVYPHSKIIRIRYPIPISTIRGRNSRGGPGVEQRRYDQPMSQTEERSTSEPYFLFGTEQYDRLYNVDLPLLMTEGELKGCALGLAGYAAIAWGGVHMWVAPKKSGKHRLHPTLDPEGPNKHWAIPLKRPVYLIPDTDFDHNQNVRKAFVGLGQALLGAGCTSVHMVRLPQPPRPEQWKGVDDYLTHHLGSRWSGNEQKIAQAREIIENLLTKHARPIRQSGRYTATSVVRTAERLYDKLTAPDCYTAVLTNQTYEGTVRLGWLSYEGDQYQLHQIDQTVGNTNGKVVVPSVDLQRMTQEEYEVGVDTAILEGDIDSKPPEMPTDFPNHVLAQVGRNLPTRANNTMIEPFEGACQGDFLIRVHRALVNVTRFFDTCGEWEGREHWLLPPNSKWFATGCMHVNLANLREKPQCPVFLDMITHGFDGDVQAITALQQFMGKIVTNPRFMGIQQFLALYGHAGGGKGTLTRLLTALLGPNNIVCMRAQFAGRFDTATLPGKRLVLFQETPDGTNEHFSPYMSEVIKNVTGQDPIVYERKGFVARQVMVDADIMTIGNDPPIIPMNAEAFERRAIFLHLYNKLKVQDYRMEAHMMQHELAGIFLWAMEGALQLSRFVPGQLIKTPDRCLLDLEDVTACVAPEERYIATQFKVISGDAADKARITNEALYEHYQAWVRQHNGRVNQVGIKRLGILLRQRYPQVRKDMFSNDGKTARGYIGLAFVNPLF